MTRVSRPLQIALVAVGLFVAVWFVALRGRSSSSEGASAPSAAASPTPASPSASGSKPSGSVYHGSAPGVEGLTRAIAKARGAVVASERNAAQLAQKSEAASGQHSSAPAGQAQTLKSLTQSAGQAKAKGGKSSSQSPTLQRTVEGELKGGRTVAILFWNPSGAVDQVVRRELQAVAGARHGKLAVHDARANQVGAFGAFTRAVQVYSTPTILIVDRHGRTSSVGGLMDAFSIEQAIAQAH